MQGSHYCGFIGQTCYSTKMRKALLTLLFLTGALALSAQEIPEAQASPAPLFYMEHPHSVTVSTGFPFILAMMYPPGSGDNALTMEGWRTGLSYKTWMDTNLNVGYNYQIDKRLEVSLLVTVCGYVYSRYAYQKTGVDEQGNDMFDWKSEPENQGIHYDLRGVMPGIMLRYYWLARKSSFQMYSAAGLAYFQRYGRVPVFPTITPLGFRFGGGHWYGVAELTAGTTATALLAGAGYRF